MSEYEAVFIENVVDIKKAIRVAMAEQGINQVELALRSGVSYEWLNKYLTTDRGIMLHSLIKIANGLGMKLSELIIKGEE